MANWGEFAYEACLDDGRIKVRPLVSVDAERGYITVLCWTEKFGEYESTVAPHWHPYRCFYPTLEAAEKAIADVAKKRLRQNRKQVRFDEQVIELIKRGERAVYVEEWVEKTGAESQTERNQ